MLLGQPNAGTNANMQPAYGLEQILKHQPGGLDPILTYDGFMADLILLRAEFFSRGFQGLVSTVSGA